MSIYDTHYAVSIYDTHYAVSIYDTHYALSIYDTHYLICLHFVYHYPVWFMFDLSLTILFVWLNIYIFNVWQISPT